jgi:CheY-like chemotaxis protein
MTDVSVHRQRVAEFVGQIRSRPQYTTTPVIAVSGWTAAFLDPVATGFTAFMLKPVDLDDLAGTLLSVIQRRTLSGR